MKDKRIYCTCMSPEKIQRHHLFRKEFREQMKQLGVFKIKLYFEKNDKEICLNLPIDIYVKFCEKCHKINHPENLNYHLHELVVESLIEKKLKNKNQGGENGNIDREDNVSASEEQCKISEASETDIGIKRD